MTKHPETPQENQELPPRQRQYTPAELLEHIRDKKSSSSIGSDSLPNPFISREEMAKRQAERRPDYGYRPLRKHLKRNRKQQLAPRKNK